MLKCSFGVGRNKDDPWSCVSEAVKDFKSPKLIIFFSNSENFVEYSQIIHETFPDTICIGSTTYRSFNSLAKDKDVLNVVAIEDGITCAAGIIKVADDYALDYADEIRDCYNKVGEKENTICIEFTIPHKRGEEYALMALNSILLHNDIPIIGGSASNSDILDKAYVSLNGSVYDTGCVYVIIHSCFGKIHLFRENIYEPLTGNRFTVTKSNSKKRTTMNYDNRPAVEVYSEELGVSVEDAQKYFFDNPIGQCIGDEIFVTAIRDIGTNGSLKHSARVHEGTDIMVMKVSDYKNITSETIEKIKNTISSPSLVIMFTCFARTLLFERENYIEEYIQKLLDAFPNFISISCLGEQLETKNFNHTMMLAVFE